MAKVQVLGSFAIGMIVSSFIFFSSFQFVDKNNDLTLGGTVLFIIGVAGYFGSILLLRKL